MRWFSDVTLLKFWKQKKFLFTGYFIYLFPIMGEIGSCHFSESIAFWHIFRESNPLLSHHPPSFNPPSPPLPVLFYTTELIGWYAILTVDEILKSAHSNESYWAKLFAVGLFAVQLGSSFKCVDEILECDHSNESYCGAVHFLWYCLLCYTRWF